MFTIPFTDGKGLIAQDQIVNINDRVRALGYADKFNPNVIVNGQDADGTIRAVPIAAYGMSLTYNCSLFTQAGLDPTKPPATWDEIRAAAKTIAEKTGVAGYAEMATENTGGWQLTTSTYANGGRMQEVGADGKVTATLNNDATKKALERLKAMRWEDNSLGSTFDYALGHDQPGILVGPGRACSPAAPTCTRRWSRTTGSSPRTTASRPSPSKAPRPASSAAAPLRRSTSSPTRLSATPRSTGSTSTTCRSC